MRVTTAKWSPPPLPPPLPYVSRLSKRLIVGRSTSTSCRLVTAWTGSCEDACVRPAVSCAESTGRHQLWCTLHFAVLLTLAQKTEGKDGVGAVVFRCKRRAVQTRVSFTQQVNTHRTVFFESFSALQIRTYFSLFGDLLDDSTIAYAHVHAYTLSHMNVSIDTISV